MDRLEEQILETIAKHPGKKAIELATLLGLDRTALNSALYGRLQGRVRSDRNYRWYIKSIGGDNTPQNESAVRLDTSLARLCRYYLDCLSHEDLGGISEFASSKFGNLNYVELSSLPMFDIAAVDPFNSPEAQRLLNQVRRDRNRQTILLGYPVRLHRIESRKGWIGFKVEPLLLFAFHDSGGGINTPTLSNDLPHLNFEALRGLSNAGDTNHMEEAIQLADDLGLGHNATDQPDLDELLPRLRQIRPEWDWMEDPDPHLLTKNIALAEISEQGIYNRAILVASERSPYTKGLESELGTLQSVTENKYRTTALGTWLGTQPNESQTPPQQPLLEVVPLNSEQRTAVQQSLSNPLTVITGPPGTGKSQVVTSILINAAWQGKTVLFASKNNKAVDVVETRINGLGSRPVLLRLGSTAFQNQLAQYLVSLMAAKATDDDQQRFNDALTEYKKIQLRTVELEVDIQSLIKHRNDVDSIEQSVEALRKDLGGETFGRLLRADYEKLKTGSEEVQAALNNADRSKQTFLVRVFWRLFCNDRFAQLLRSSDTFRDCARELGLSVPEHEPDLLSIHQWMNFRHQLDQQLSKAAEIHRYAVQLNALSQAQSLEKIAKERLRLTEELSSHSDQLWEAWLRLQPSRLTPPQRKLLGDYSALLQMIVAANEKDRQLSGDVFRRYYKLFPQITSILSCWAVTSLSARSRVPFEPQFFDLLVIDEASQCDIASALPLLYRSRQVTIIGDPMQLRHISSLGKQKDQQLLGKHGLIEDYSGWAYSTRSLFDLASSVCRSEDIVALRDHHRSHAEIIEFSNKAFYGGDLRVATKHDLLKRPLDDGPALRWIDIEGNVVRPESGGAVNEKEAALVVTEIARLVSQGYRGSIGVVSPFRAQANRIRDLVYQQSDLTTRLADAAFLADTVHKFQGDERDIIFFSPVVSKGIGDGALSFLRGNPNLFNVAITRARAALIVVGDKSMARQCGVEYLSQFTEYIDKIRCEPQINDHHVPDLGPEYPKVAKPELVSAWEHRFYKAMYRSGVRPIPQYSIEKYLLDFALLDGNRRLNIEIDGERYHRNWDGELCRRDQIRNQRLMELGWDVMRFWVYQIRDDQNTCLKRIHNWLQQTSHT